MNASDQSAVKTSFCLLLFPIVFLLLVFVVGKWSLLFEFTKNSVKAPALQSADNVVPSQNFVANKKKTSNASLFCGMYVIMLTRRTITLLYNRLHTVSLRTCLFEFFSNAQILKNGHICCREIKLVVLHTRRVINSRTLTFVLQNDLLD
jgi:hypothetical protein